MYRCWIYQQVSKQLYVYMFTCLHVFLAFVIYSDDLTLRIINLDLCTRILKILTFNDRLWTVFNHILHNTSFIKLVLFLMATHEINSLKLNVRQMIDIYCIIIIECLDSLQNMTPSIWTGNNLKQVFFKVLFSI